MSTYVTPSTSKIYDLPKKISVFEVFILHHYDKATFTLIPICAQISLRLTSSISVYSDQLLLRFCAWLTTPFFTSTLPFWRVNFVEIRSLSKNQSNVNAVDWDLNLQRFCWLLVPSQRSEPLDYCSFSCFYHPGLLVKNSRNMQVEVCGLYISTICHPISRNLRSYHFKLIQTFYVHCKCPFDLFATFLKF